MKSNQTTNTIKIKRFYFLDNLRTVIIFLVIMLHASGPYLAGDGWQLFWIVEDPANNAVSGIIFLLLDIFLMASLFFISGVLVPASLKRKSGWEFIKGKLKRLILPWAVSVLTLIPLYKVIFRFSRGLPQENWTTYFHITNPNSQNWLWFLPVLFAFNLLYLLFTKANLRLPKLSAKTAVIISFVIGVAYTLAMDLLGLKGWTLTPLLDFQNERILIYFMFFMLGALFYNHGVFASKPEKKTLYTIVNSTSWLPINVYIFIVLWPIVFNPGNFLFSRVIDRALVAFTFHLTLYSLVYTLVESFRFYGDKANRVWVELNRNSYYVYIIHVIVTGIITLLLRDTGIPSLLKHFIQTITTFVVSNLIVSGVRAAFHMLRPNYTKSTMQTSTEN